MVEISISRNCEISTVVVLNIPRVLVFPKRDFVRVDCLSEQEIPGGGEAL
jgi:hypothetical protein